MLQTNVMEIHIYQILLFILERFVYILSLNMPHMTQQLHKITSFCIG